MRNEGGEGLQNQYPRISTDGREASLAAIEVTTLLEPAEILNLLDDTVITLACALIVGTPGIWIDSIDNKGFTIPTERPLTDYPVGKA